MIVGEGAGRRAERRRSAARPSRERSSEAAPSGVIGSAPPPEGAWPVAQIRAAEGVRLARTAEGALMQTAAAGLATVCARILRARRGRVTGARVVLLVGAGNNGGDALWAGRRLAGRGAAVTALLTAATAHAEGLAALRSAGGRVHRVTGPDDAVARRVLGAAELLVDGLVGLGGTPGLREPALGLWQHWTALGRDAPVVAVDLPSGVDPDTGETPGPHVVADHTVTFGAAKPCLLLPPACRAAGEVTVVGLGFDEDHGEDADRTARLPRPPAVVHERPVAAEWPVPAPGDDKYRRGVLGVVAGSTAYRGAAVLACGGAVRAGVGMIRYQGPDRAVDAVLAHWPEVVVGEGRVQAFLLGSGVDPGGASPEDHEQAARIAAVLRGEGHATHQGVAVPCVVDAGALAVLAGLPDREDVLTRERSRTSPGGPGPRLLLTPHAGELATLLSALAGTEVSRTDVESAPWRHACRVADLTGATVLLKGAVTLVVEPSGSDGRRRTRTAGPAPSWLATAGSGDVLAGIAGALLAAGLSPARAGGLAAAVHGIAGRSGPLGAGALADAVPDAVREVLDRRHEPGAGRADARVRVSSWGPDDRD